MTGFFIGWSESEFIGNCAEKFKACDAGMSERKLDIRGAVHLRFGWFCTVQKYVYTEVVGG